MPSQAHLANPLETDKILFQGSFDVETDLETTMKFLLYAEMYPLEVEPGWEDGTAFMGDVRNGGKEFDAMMTNDEGDTFVCGVISNRVVTSNSLTYNF